MNSTTTNQHSQAKKSTTNSTARILNVAFDVSSETLNWSMELREQAINDACLNASVDIRKTLDRISSLDMQPTSFTVKPVAKFRAIQFADPGKTDRRDPQAALKVAKVGRLIKHRQQD